MLLLLWGGRWHDRLEYLLLHQAAYPEKETKLIAILAGNYSQFKKWQQSNQDKQAVYCDYWPQFAGLEFSEMVEVGTFRERKDALDLWQRVAPMVRTKKAPGGAKSVA